MSDPTQNLPAPPPALDEGKHHGLAIRRPVTMAMVFLTLVVFGWKSYQELPVNLMPDISYPTLTVRTEYEGAAPEDVEKLLTRPLEETLSIVGGMVEISSISRPGLSEIVLEFTWDTDMNTAQQDVRDRLDLFMPPREVTEKPVILRYDPTLDPVIRVAITGSDLKDITDKAEREKRGRQELTLIREACERHVKSDLEGELGIAQVHVKGGRQEEIQVLVDAEKLKNLGMSLQQIVNNLAQQNINLSGGRLKEGKSEYLVRTLNEFQEVSQIQDTIIGVTRQARQIRLADVATVHVGEKDRDTIVRIEGREAVELEIYKWGDANTVEVCNKIKDLLGFKRERSFSEQLAKSLSRIGQTSGRTPEEEEDAELARTLRSRLPDYASYHLISDQSRFISDSIDEVKSSAIQGGFLALFILYFFLREMKSTIIIGVSIPISVVATFVPMFMQGITLNIMSLGGLALGIGMLVDNSIVVLESIFRCREEGDGVVDAASRGTHEVASAVTSSTLTSVAVFFPIAFVEGVAGQLFRDQALTVTYSLLASLLAAMYLVPMIASRQKIELLHGEDVIWVLKAYHEARRTDGKGRLESIALIPVYAVMMVIRWLTETILTTMAPLGRLWQRIFGKEGSFLIHGVVRLGLLRLIVAAVMLALLLACQLLLGAVAAFLITFLFFISLGALAFAWCVGKALYVLMWIPLALFDIVYRWLSNQYVAMLRRLLVLSPAVLALVLLVAMHAGFTAQKLGRELIPSMKQGEFGIRLEAPPGTRLEETERHAADIERIALAVPEVETVAVEIGQEKSKAGGERGENVARFSITLRDPEVNVLRQDAIIDALRREVEGATSDKLTFTLPSLFSFKTALELQIRGDDLTELRQVGERTLEAIRDVPGLKDLDLSMKRGYPEVIIELDRDLLASKGLTPDQVAQCLRREVQGDIATRFNRGGEKVDIRVRSDRERLASLQDLRRLSVVDATPPIPLESVASIRVEDGPSEIRRVDQRQVAIVSGNIEGRDLGSVAADVAARLEEVDKPADFEFSMAGQNRELATSSRSLMLALALATFLVYVVMACQFESFIHPMLVMASVPLALIGAVYALYLDDLDVSIMVYIGGIILVGIVVNNAIVLVDYVNQLRARGIPKREAVVLAGQVRLRPILMTTITTVLGLLPMAFSSGEGAEMRRPLALTIMAGLGSSTLLTLVIIPMVYYLFGGRDKPGFGAPAAPETPPQPPAAEA